MRVNDEIGTNTLAGKRHVFHSEQHAACALLTVTGGELVANLRRLHSPHLHLDELVALVANAQHHLRNQAKQLESDALFFFEWRRLFIHYLVDDAGFCGP